MKKRFYSVSLAAALIAAVLPCNALATDTMEITSIKADGLNVTVSFDAEVDSQTVAGNIIVIDDTGTRVDVGQPSVSGNNVIVNLDKTAVAKDLAVGINDEIASVGGLQLDKDYISEFSVDGYFEDFAEGNDDWYLHGYNSNNNGKLVDAYNGGIKPLSYSRTYNDGTADITYSGDATITYKSDYSDYSFADQNLYFDYTRELDTAGDNNSKSWIDFKAFLRAGNFTYTRSPYQYVISDGAYYFRIGTQGTIASIGKVSGTWPMDNQQNLPSGATQLASTNAYTFEKGVTYSFKLNAQDTADGVRITAYLKNNQGQYTQILTALDAESLSSSGSSYFATNNTNWNAMNAHILDNIGFSEIKAVTPAAYSAYENKIVTQINTAYNGNAEYAQIRALSKKAEFIDSLTGAFNSDAAEKIAELMQFELKSVNTEASDVKLGFSQPVDPTSLTNQIAAFDEKGNIINAVVNVNADDNTIVDVTLPISVIGTKVNLLVNDGVSSVDDAELEDAKYIPVNFNGFYEDFGAKYSGNFKMRAWGKDVVITPEENGMILPVSGTTGGYLTNGGAIYRVSYSDYDYADQTLYFDYMRKSKETVTDPTVLPWCNFRAFIRTNDFSFDNSAATFTINGGYFLGIEKEGTQLLIGKINGDWSAERQTGFEVIPASVTELKRISIDTLAAQTVYSFKLTAVDTADGKVKITAYIKDGNGVYTEVISATDATDVISTGSFFFTKGTSNWGAENFHYIDNVAYTSTVTAVPVDASVYEQEIVSEINSIYNDDGDTDYTEDLETIGKKIDIIKEVTGAFNAQAESKYDELMQFKLMSVKTDDKSLILKFNQGLNAEVLEDEPFELYDAAGEYVDITCTIDENDARFVTIPLSDSLIGQRLKLIIYDGITSVADEEIISPYYVNFTFDGFSEDFSNYQNDWKLTSWSYQNGKVVDSYLGGIKPLSNPATDETTGLTYPRQSMIVYKDGYSNYSYNSNQYLYFDYMREFDSSDTSSAAEEQVNFKAFIMSDLFAYTSSANNLIVEDGAYYLNIENKGKKLSIGKLVGEWSMNTLKTVPADATGLASNTTVNFASGVNYSFKLEALKETDGVRINAYVKDSNGVYNKVLSAFDTQNPLTGGSSYFVTGSPTSYFASSPNAYIIDNVSFVGSQLLTTVNVDEKIDEINSRLNYIKENEVDWLQFANEVNGYVDDLEIFDYIPKAAQTISLANEILAGRPESDICAIMSAPVIARLKTKYEDGDQLVIAGVGGSLTQGGTAMGRAVVNYIAEQIGATGLQSGDIQVITSTDLTNDEDFINSNAKFVYLNAGNGGQASDWHSTRLYSDVMCYNPDVVLIDYAGNDDNLARMQDGEHQTKTYTETTIRRLLKSENPPEIMMIYIPTQLHIQRALLKDAGISGKYTLNQDGTTYTITQFDESSYVYQREIAKYYDIAQIDLVQAFAAKATLDYSSEELDSVVKYFRVASVVDGKTYYEECESTDDGATKAIDGTKVHLPVIDFEGIAQRYDLDLEDYTSNTLEKINSDYASSYTTGMSEEDLLNTFQRFGADKTHSTAAGYSLYADMVSWMLENDKNAAMRTEALPQKPYKVPVYDDVNLKRISVSESIIDAMDNFTVTGGSYENKKFMSNRGVVRNGVQFNGPCTIEYKFKGNSIYIESTNIDRTPVAGETQTVTYASGLGNALIDGRAYNQDTVPYLNSYMMTDDAKHTLTIEVEDGKTLLLGGIYVDEDAYWDKAELAEDKYVTIDISKAANIYGAAKATDGKVFSNEYVYWKDGSTNSGKYGTASLSDKKKYAPDILVNYKEDNYQYVSVNADAVKDYFENDYDGTIPYDLSVLDNTRYRALSLSNALNADKFFNSMPTIIDVTDDFYENVNILAVSRNDIIDGSAKLTFNYVDGTSDEVAVDIYKSYGTPTDISAVDDVSALFTSRMRNNFNTNNLSGSSATVNQYTVAVPNSAKRVKSVTFSSSANGNTVYIYAVTMKKIYDGALFDVEFNKVGGGIIYDLSEYAGETVEVSYSLGSNLTSGINGELYLAIYDGNKLIKAIKTDDITLQDTYVNKVTAVFSVPEDFDSDYTVKAMLWDGNIKPLTVRFDY